MSYERELRLLNGWLHRGRQADAAAAVGSVLVGAGAYPLFTGDSLGGVATVTAGILAIWLAGSAWKNIGREMRGRLP